MIITNIIHYEPSTVKSAWYVRYLIYSLQPFDVVNYYNAHFSDVKTEAKRQIT